MRVTKKKQGRVKKRRRTKNGPALIVDLAQFLNLDLAKCEIHKRWHYFQSWPRYGIPNGATDTDLKRYSELKLLTTLLEESDIQPGRPDLIEHLQGLQDEIKALLKPILRSSPKKNEQNEINQGIRGGIESIVARLNRCTYSPNWALYSDRKISDQNLLKGWHCTYDPKDTSSITTIDPVILAQQRVLRLGEYRYVVKEIQPRFRSIADRLYWIVGQTLITACISRLKTCVECEKYFSAYDSKQVVCSLPGCRQQHNRKGTSARVKRLRIREAKNRIFHPSQQS